MPVDPGELPFLGPDIAELVAVFLTMAVSFIVMVVLGNWWAR